MGLIVSEEVAAGIKARDQITAFTSRFIAAEGSLKGIFNNLVAMKTTFSDTEDVAIIDAKITAGKEILQSLINDY